MPVTDFVLLLAGWTLAALTIRALAREASLRPFFLRVEMAVVVAVLAGALLAGEAAVAASAHAVLGPVFALVFLALPYVVLRLVQRFHHVPAALVWITIGVPIAGALAWRSPVPAAPIAAIGLPIYFAAILSYCASAFRSEARRAHGATSARLRFVATATWLQVAVAAIFELQAVGVPLGSFRSSIVLLLGVGVLAASYAGFGSPRALRSAWRRAALQEYFLDAAGNAPEMRAEHAAANLDRAAGRGVASVARAVLLAGGGRPSPLVARSASVAGWSALAVSPGGGLVGQAIARGVPMTGRPRDCEPEVAVLAAHAGSSVYVVPIGGADRNWGVLIVVQERGSLFPDEDVELLQVLSRQTAMTLDQGREVAEKREMERRLLDERLRQAQRMEALGQLAGGIAHDFNNLLTAALAHVGSIEMHPRFDPVFDEPIAGIRDVARRAADLTGHLLAFSRQQAVQARLVNLRDVVADMLPTLGRVLESRIEISFAGVTAPVPILADPVQIEQVVLNLAVNARDAMPDGGRLTICVTAADITEPRHVGTTALQPGRYARLIMSDTGIGMDAATKSRIFEPFFTTKAEGHGTGLGLSTVYGIVTQMGGRIAVDTAPAGGATFDIYLPVASTTADATEVADEEVAGGAETILVVEDHPVVRRQVTDWLASRGYAVIESEHPAEARAKTTGHPGVDLALTDVVMPGGTGLELMATLRETQPNLPALFISGYAKSALVQHALLPPGADFMQKPLAESDLVRRVRQILDARRASRT